MRVKKWLVLLAVLLIMGAGGVLGEKKWLEKDFRVPYFGVSDKERLMEAVGSANLVAELPLEVSGDTIIASISGVRVLFSRKGDFELQLRALQLALTRIKMEGKAAKEVDLRFDKVIVRN